MDPRTRTRNSLGHYRQCHTHTHTHTHTHAREYRFKHTTIHAHETHCWILVSTHTHTHTRTWIQILAHNLTRTIISYEWQWAWDASFVIHLYVILMDESRMRWVIRMFVTHSNVCKVTPWVISHIWNFPNEQRGILLCWSLRTTTPLHTYQQLHMHMPIDRPCTCLPIISDTHNENYQ